MQTQDGIGANIAWQPRLWGPDVRVRDVSPDGESYLCHPADDRCRLSGQWAKAATLTRCYCARRGPPSRA